MGINAFKERALGIDFKAGDPAKTIEERGRRQRMNKGGERRIGHVEIELHLRLGAELEQGFGARAARQRTEQQAGG